MTDQNIQIRFNSYDVDYDVEYVQFRLDIPVARVDVRITLGLTHEEAILHELEVAFKNHLYRFRKEICLAITDGLKDSHST